MHHSGVQGRGAWCASELGPLPEKASRVKPSLVTLEWYSGKAIITVIAKMIVIRSLLSDARQNKTVVAVVLTEMVMIVIVE